MSRRHSPPNRPDYTPQTAITARENFLTANGSTPGAACSMPTPKRRIREIAVVAALPTSHKTSYVTFSHETFRAQFLQFCLKMAFRPAHGDLAHVFPRFRVFPCIRGPGLCITASCGADWRPGHAGCQRRRSLSQERMFSSGRQVCCTASAALVVAYCPPGRTCRRVREQRHRV